MPADDDLKQMFTYNLFWKCDKSILLYPARLWPGGDESNHGEYHDFTEQKDFNTKCAVETVSVLKGMKLDKELGKSILKKVIS